MEQCVLPYELFNIERILNAFIKLYNLPGKSILKG